MLPAGNYATLLCVLFKRRKDCYNPVIRSGTPPHKEVFIMSLKNLFSLGRDRDEKPAACGTACGSGDKKPTACGTACGTGDKK